MLVNGIWWDDKLCTGNNEMSSPSWKSSLNTVYMCQYKCVIYISLVDWFLFILFHADPGGLPCNP